MQANLRLSLALLVTAAAHAQAADPAAHAALGAITVREGGRVIVDCRNERLPNLHQVGAVLGTNNGSRIYAERERLVHAVHRECMRGAESVAFVRDDAAGAPQLALADAARR